jgi:hypothetical protein
MSLNLEYHVAQDPAVGDAMSRSSGADPPVALEEPTSPPVVEPMSSSFEIEEMSSNEPENSVQSPELPERKMEWALCKDAEVKTVMNSMSKRCFKGRDRMLQRLSQINPRDVGAAIWKQLITERGGVMPEESDHPSLVSAFMEVAKSTPPKKTEQMKKPAKKLILRNTPKEAPNGGRDIDVISVDMGASKEIDEERMIEEGLRIAPVESTSDKESETVISTSKCINEESIQTAAEMGALLKRPPRALVLDVMEQNNVYCLDSLKNKKFAEMKIPKMHRMAEMELNEIFTLVGGSSLPQLALVRFQAGLIQLRDTFGSEWTFATFNENQMARFLSRMKTDRRSVEVDIKSVLLDNAKNTDLKLYGALPKFLVVARFIRPCELGELERQLGELMDYRTNTNQTMTTSVLIKILEKLLCDFNRRPAEKEKMNFLRFMAERQFLAFLHVTTRLKNGGAELNKNFRPRNERSPSPGQNSFLEKGGGKGNRGRWNKFGRAGPYRPPRAFMQNQFGPAAYPPPMFPMQPQGYFPQHRMPNHFPSPGRIRSTGRDGKSPKRVDS